MPPAESAEPAPATDLTQPVGPATPIPPIDATQPTYPAEPAHSAPPAEPPQPAEPLAPRSTVAAMVGNLTGLGLGYAYLRRLWRTGFAILGTAVIAALAFWTGAAGVPWGWRGLVILWLGALALDAGLLALRHPRPARPVLPVAGAVLAVAVVAAGYVFYGVAGRTAYVDGLAAQARGDCTTAVGEFDDVTGLYELTLSPDVTAAGARRTECEVYQRAVATAEPETAVARFLDFSETYPRSALADFAEDHLVAAYDKWAPALREDAAYDKAIEVYRDRLELRDDADVTADLAETYLEQAASIPTDTGDVVVAATKIVGLLSIVRTEFADTPAAAKVPAAFAAAYQGATKPYAAGKFCDALPALGYFAGLDKTTAGATATEADAHHSKALLECGLSLLRGNDSTTAQTRLQEFLTGYPRHPRAAQGRSAMIAAKVAAAFGKPMPVPPPLGGNNPGPNRVVFYNDSSDSPVHVLMTGPTAHEFTIPKCGAVCPADYSLLLGAQPCPTYDGRPSVTLNLPAGTYYFATERDTDVTNLNDTVAVRDGFIHENCLYVQRGL